MTDTTSSQGGTDECIAQTCTAPGRFLLPSCFRFSNKTFLYLYSLIFFEFQIPDSGFRIPHSGFRIPYSVFRIPYSVLRIAYCVLRIAYCVLRIAYCVLRIAYCVLRIAYCVLRIAYCVLHIAYSVFRIPYSVFRILGFRVLGLPGSESIFGSLRLVIRLILVQSGFGRSYADLKNGFAQRNTLDIRNPDPDPPKGTHP